MIQFGPYANLNGVYHLIGHIYKK